MLVCTRLCVLWFGECGDAAYEFRDGIFLQITKKLSVCAPLREVNLKLVKVI
jgi:hypothetical protein